MLQFSSREGGKRERRREKGHLVNVYNLELRRERKGKEEEEEEKRRK